MIELLHQLLKVTVDAEGSDLHIVSDGSAKIRINGTLKKVPLSDPISVEQINEMILASVPNDLRKVLEEDYEVDYLYVLGEFRFRVNAFKSQSNYEAVFRVIKQEVLNLSDLNIPPAVNELSTLHNGLVLIVGATGSGKTTTLAGLIDKINKTASKVIITIENPVEFLHRSDMATISQREVGIDTKSFPAALRSALRQDPDVIIIGEIRDAETARIALEAAQTGHMVMATMHASDTADAINRFINLFPSGEKDLVRVMLADTLKGIVGQRLIKTTEGGRVPAIEILIKNLRVEEIIKGLDEDGSLKDAVSAGASLGMQTFDDSLLNLAVQGKISVEEAKRNCSNMQALSMKLKQQGLE